MPGIVLGTPVAVVGFLLNEPKVVDAAFMMLILNGFNLLPFLPLDGGWVVHAVLFVRSPVLDVVFRVVAALGMIGIAYLLTSWFLGVIAVTDRIIARAVGALEQAREIKLIGDAGAIRLRDFPRAQRSVIRCRRRLR